MSRAPAAVMSALAIDPGATRCPMDASASTQMLSALRDDLRRLSDASPRVGAMAAQATTKPAASGSRKRKAYLPRNAGDDTDGAPSAWAARDEPPAKLPRLAASPRAAERQLDTSVAVRWADPNRVNAAPPAAAEPRTCGDEATTSNDANIDAWRVLSRAVRRSALPLALARSRRGVKPRRTFDPADFDLSTDDSEPTSDGQDSVPLGAAAALLPHRTAADEGAAVPDCAPRPRLGRRSDCKANWTDEQKLFQDFRKLRCLAYTGVIVHCQNMKLEARVNMVSYLPRKERKISGGQIYIAYMTNPHQAAVVHDITASIITADGILIYHNHNVKPSDNADVRMERLNYTEDLNINTQRGGAKGADRAERVKGGKLDERRFRGMLPRQQLLEELHRWVAHEGRWMTFKAWVEEYLFEAKLANMAILPKVIDEQYLRPEERKLLLKLMPEYQAVVKTGAGVEALALTHMYDQLTLERVVGPDGSTTSFKLVKKMFRRRRPQFRGGHVKWSEDRDDKLGTKEAPTAEDQRRVDIAWGVVQRWLASYDPAKQDPLPDYEAVDASYHVTWRHFAQWINHLLESVPAELDALKDKIQAAEAAATPGRRGQKEVSPDSEASRASLARLRAAHEKYRAVVTPGQLVSLDWRTAAPAHRAAFERFFHSSKAQPPSHLQSARRAAAQPAPAPPAASDAAAAHGGGASTPPQAAGDPLACASSYSAAYLPAPTAFSYTRRAPLAATTGGAVPTHRGGGWSAFGSHGGNLMTPLLAPVCVPFTSASALDMQLSAQTPTSQCLSSFGSFEYDSVDALPNVLAAAVAARNQMLLGSDQFLQPPPTCGALGHPSLTGGHDAKNTLINSMAAMQRLYCEKFRALQILSLSDAAGLGPTAGMPFQAQAGFGDDGVPAAPASASPCQLSPMTRQSLAAAEDAAQALAARLQAPSPSPHPGAAGPHARRRRSSVAPLKRAQQQRSHSGSASSSDDRLQASVPPARVPGRRPAHVPCEAAPGGSPPRDGLAALP